MASTSVAIALAVVGSLAGVVYASLGIAALKHLPKATSSDRVVGWSLWWFAEPSRYTTQGQALCRKGGAAFVVAVAAWLGWFALR